MERSSIENYFDLSAIKKVIGEGVPEDIQTLENNISVDAQLGLSLQHRSIRIQNSEIINSMELSQLQDTDLLEFCLNIKAVLDGKPQIKFVPRDNKIINIAEKYA